MRAGGPRLHLRTSAAILGGMWRIVLVAASTVPLASCASKHAHPEQYGAMRAVMREGQTEARVTVCDVADGRTRFGVGALEGLSGEVTIDSGEVWVSRVEAGKPVTTGPGCTPTDRATLLSVGSIENPVTSTIEIAMADESLEEAIGRAGALVGMPREPFMFAIDATATMLRAHVIAGTCAHADPNAEAFRLSIDVPLQIRIVGLYAAGAPGVLTHHGSNVHMHAIFVHMGQRMTAHIDSIALAAGARLSVPGNAHEARAERDFPGTADRSHECRRAIRFGTVLAQGSK